MGTSALGGAILYDPGDLDTDEPLDTVLVRDEVVGSALHYADEAGQVRASWVATIAGANAAPYLEVRDLSGDGLLSVATASRAAWYAFPLRARFFPKIKSDGSGYRLRVWIAGASSAGDRVDFGVVVAPHQADASGYDGRGVEFARATNVIATSPAWLAFDSGLMHLDIDGAMIARALDLSEPVATLTDIGGAVATVRQPSIEVIVIAQRWDLDSEPHLYGFHAAEYIGP